MSHEVVRQKRIRIVQSVVLALVMLVLASRAVSVVLGPVAGWIAVALFGVLALRAATAQQFPFPRGTRRLEWHQAPQLYAELNELVRRAGLERVPPIYILPSYGGEALTAGVGQRSVIVLSHGLLNTLTPRELRAVLAHEVSHIRNHDLPLFAVMAAMHRITHAVSAMLMVLLVVAFPLVLFGAVALPGSALLYLGVVPLISLVAQFALLRTREFQADLGAVELTNDPDALASALGRLERLQRPVLQMLGLAGTRRSRIAELLRTHPSTEERIERLEELRRSA